MMKIRTACIVGTGAAGAFAYQALKGRVPEINILSSSHGKPSPGAFYFHWLPDQIGDMFEPDAILYLSVGNWRVYQKKQWPEVTKLTPGSFPLEPTEEVGWDANWVWDAMWEGATIELMAAPFSDTDMKDLGKYHDMVIQTFPSQESKNKQPPLAPIPIQKYESFQLGDNLLTMIGEYDNFILYSGSTSHPWVRMSHLFGQMFFEYPYTSPLAKGGPGIEIRMDIPPNTPKWSKRIAPNVIPVGRLATWDRKCLSHDAYRQTLDALKELEEKDT